MEIRGREFRVNVFDVGGDERYAEVRSEFYKDSNGVLLVFDVTSRRSFQNLDQWMTEVTKNSQGGAALPCAVVAAKVEATPRAVSEQEARGWASGRKLEYFEVSAALALNVEAPFHELARKNA